MGGLINLRSGRGQYKLAKSELFISLLSIYITKWGLPPEFTTFLSWNAQIPRISSWVFRTLLCAPIQIGSTLKGFLNGLKFSSFGLYKKTQWQKSKWSDLGQNCLFRGRHDINTSVCTTKGQGIIRVVVVVVAAFFCHSHFLEGI